MKLSIITINYNNSFGLRKTVESVVNQTCKEFEYIVIDGNSDDGSKDVIFEYKNHFAYWVSEQDTGIYNAMNKGIKQSKGDYLLFLNSGDYLENPKTIHSVIQYLNTYDIIYGNMVIDHEGKLEYAKSLFPLQFEEMIRGTLWHPVSFIKKELFDKYGLYNETYRIISDYEFFLKTIFVERVSTFYVDLFIAVFNTSGIGSSEKYKDVHDREKSEVQLKLFHPEVINSSKRFSYLKRSKAVVFYNWLKTKPVLLGIAKVVYSFGKKIK